MSRSTARRRNALRRFVDSSTRPQPLGGDIVRFTDYTGGEHDDCLEISPAVWDAATGTLISAAAPGSTQAPAPASSTTS